MPKKQKPSWTPATQFKVTKLKRNGPKKGQTLDSFLYGKTKGHQEHMDNPRNKMHNLP